VRLTAKERILLHLFEYSKFADVIDVPPDIAQEGIARAVGIRVQHVRQFVGPLIREGLVRERIAHVLGHRRRLKVYNLTEPGRLETARLRGQVRADVIRVRDVQGVRETSIGDALGEVAGRATLSDLVREAIEGRVVDLDAIAAVRAGPEGTLVERLGEAPRVEGFVGRHEELEAIAREGGTARIFVIRGVPGIGKSSLAAKVCERLRGSRNLYWHRIRPWDTRLSILASLANFLSAVGRPGLRAILSRGEPGTADDALRADLPGTRSVLVFDDAHEGIQEVFSFLRFLKDVIASVADVRAIILTRRSIPAYDRQDVVIRGLVHEIDLQGLREAEIQELLRVSPDAARVADAARRLGGHPLFLELIRSAGERGLAVESLRDVRAYVEEEIYSVLSDGERRMMKTAALFSVPFPREAVLSDPTLSHDTLRSLMARSLIRPIGPDSFGVHDTIRDFFVSSLTPYERKSLGLFAVTQLQRLAEGARRAKDFIAALNCLSNALELAESREQQAILCERLGDTYERLGDLPAALVSYSEAIRHTDDPESVARLHRKTAAALQIRGEMAPAIDEIDAGFKALGGRPSIERGWLDLTRCQAASWQEQWEEAVEHGEAALTAFRAAGNLDAEVQTLLELGKIEIYSPRGNVAKAESCLTSALDSSKALGDVDYQARSHVGLALLYANRMGDVARATRHLETCAGLEDSIADPHILRGFLMIRAWFALYQQQDFAVAKTLFNRAAAHARRIHDRRTQADAGHGLGYVLLFKGQLEEARQAFRDFEIAMRDVGVPGDRVDALWDIAESSLLLGDVPEFRRLAAMCRDPQLSDGAAARPLYAGVLEGLDQLLAGDPDRCRDAFEETLRLATTSHFANDAMLNGFVRFYYGVALRAMGDESKGEESVSHALRLLEESGLRAPHSAFRKSEPSLVAVLRGSVRER